MRKGTFSFIDLPVFFSSKTDKHVMKQAQRSPEEEGDFMAFEQLVAEAAIKKEKEKDKEERKKKKHGHSHATEPAAEASTTTA